MIPAEFTGGWVRVSLSLDGAKPAEDMLVWWLQAPTWHADLRVPVAPDGDAISFAGRTSWDAPWLTWTPELALVPSDFPDTGAVSWDGDDLLEAGTFPASAPGGAEVAYVERWRRLPDSAEPLMALSKPGGRIVRTGSYALTLLDDRSTGGAFVSVGWRLTGEVWKADHRWPEEAAATVPPVTADLLPGSLVLLDDGDYWTVDEAPISPPKRKLVPAHG